MTKRFELIITWAAIFLSICAFFVSIYQTQVLKKQTDIMQEQKHAAVWPRLFTAKNTGSNHYVFTLQNDGVGPAIIKYVEISVNNKTIKTWDDLVLITNDSIIANIGRSMVSNRVIRAGESISMCSLLDSSLIKNIYIKKPKISIDIYYQSVYGRTWRLYQKAGEKFAIPEIVDNYPINPEKEFLN